MKSSFPTFWLQAALLHDTVEDTDTSFYELQAEFGEDVASELGILNALKFPGLVKATCLCKYRI